MSLEQKEILYSIRKVMKDLPMDIILTDDDLAEVEKILQIVEDEYTAK